MERERQTAGGGSAAGASLGLRGQMGHRGRSRLGTDVTKWHTKQRKGEGGHSLGGVCSS